MQSSINERTSGATEHNQQLEWQQSLQMQKMVDEQEHKKSNLGPSRVTSEFQKQRTKRSKMFTPKGQQAQQFYGAEDDEDADDAEDEEDEYDDEDDLSFKISTKAPRQRNIKLVHYVDTFQRKLRVLDSKPNKRVRRNPDTVKAAAEEQHEQEYRQALEDAVGDTAYYKDLLKGAFKMNWDQLSHQKVQRMEQRI